MSTPQELTQATILSATEQTLACQGFNTLPAATPALSTNSALRSAAPASDQQLPFLAPPASVASEQMFVKEEPSLTESSSLGKLKNKVAKLQHEMRYFALQIAEQQEVLPYEEMVPLFQQLRQKGEFLELMRDFLARDAACSAQLTAVGQPPSSPVSFPAGDASTSSMPCPSSSPCSNRVTEKKKVVPNGLPFFQWRGQVFDDKAKVFEDIDDCLQNFTDVLNNWGQPLDTEWYRLIRQCLTKNMREWLHSVYVKQFTMNSPWARFVEEFKKEFGPAAAAAAIEEKRATKELLRMTHPSLESTQSYQGPNFSKNLCNEIQCKDLESVIATAESSAVKLDVWEDPFEASLSHGEKRLSFSSADDSTDGHQHKKTKGSKSPFPSSSSSSPCRRRNAGPSASREDRKENSSRKSLWCAHHRNCNHVTEDCRILKKLAAEHSSKGKQPTVNDHAAHGNYKASDLILSAMSRPDFPLARTSGSSPAFSD